MNKNRMLLWSGVVASLALTGTALGQSSAGLQKFGDLSINLEEIEQVYIGKAQVTSGQAPGVSFLAKVPGAEGNEWTPRQPTSSQSVVALRTWLRANWVEMFRPLDSQGAPTPRYEVFTNPKDLKVYFCQKWMYGAVEAMEVMGPGILRQQLVTMETVGKVCPL